MSGKTNAAKSVPQNQVDQILIGYAARTSVKNNRLRFKTNNHFIFMNRHIIIVLLVAGQVFHIGNLNAQNTPGENFDLSAWKLQTLADLDSSRIEVNPVGTHTSNFFYTNSVDDAMAFKVPSNGGTTPNASYPRVELRQLGTGANWPLADINEHYLSAQCRVMEVSEVKPKIIIGQIHGSQSNSELLKIRWTGYEPGDCIIEARFQTDDNVGSEYGVTLASGLSLGDTINYTVTMIQGVVEVTINGNTASQTYTSQYYGTTDRYYFKAGSYIQWNEEIVGPTVVSGETLFYELEVEENIISALPSINTNNSLTVYPNPATDYVVLNSDLIAQSNTGLEVTDIAIIDSKGMLIKKISLSYSEIMNGNSLKINLSDLSSGNYVIQIISDQFVETRRFIISK